MDELLIEDKKYVSSKRAAKMTGYAKDYIGQLCREGRVSARLVGRSWYVLESAIHDHRFGGLDVKADKENVFSSTWESPRYEATPTERALPVNELDSQPELPPRESADFSEQLQDSWKAWFERVSVESPGTVQDEAETPAEESAPTEEHADKSEEGMNVPIRAIHHRPPEELLPRRVYTTGVSHERETVEESPYLEEVVVMRGGRVFGVVKAVGAVLAVASVLMAVIGTGYFDKYITSSKPVSLMAGVILYDR